MRVAIYWEQDSWGGVDAHLLELLSSWPEREDEFVLFYNRGNRGFERIRGELEHLPNVRSVAIASSSHNELSRRVRVIPGHRILRGILYASQPITFSLMAWRLSHIFANAGRFDLLLADNGGYPAARGCLSALVAARRAGIPVRVLLVHHEATRPAALFGWFERLVDRMVTETADAIVCVSQATRQSLLDRRHLDPEAVRVIHNGIAPISGAEAGGRTIDVRQAVNAGDAVVIGIVGRVEAYKGHEDLICALAGLDDRDRGGMCLAVIGAGEAAEVNRLRQLADRLGVADRVHFLGYVQGRSSDLMGQLDLLVVATRTFEGFGLTAMEAMQAGTPVLATRVGGIPEFVDDSIGVLVDAASPQQLSAALQDFLCNRAAWRRRADRAREWVSSRPSMALEYRRLFVECIAEQ